MPQENEGFEFENRSAYEDPRVVGIARGIWKTFSTDPANFDLQNLAWSLAPGATSVEKIHVGEEVLKCAFRMKIPTLTEKILSKKYLTEFDAAVAVFRELGMKNDTKILEYVSLLLKARDEKVKERPSAQTQQVPTLVLQTTSVLSEKSARRADKGARGGPLASGGRRHRSDIDD